MSQFNDIIDLNSYKVDKFHCVLSVASLFDRQFLEVHGKSISVDTI